MTLPLAAASDVSAAVTDLFLVLLAAKIGDEVFKRMGQPAVIGEVLAGLIVGPSVLGVVEPGEVIEVFAELGVVFLLFWVGLEVRISDMREVGRPAAQVGVLGVVIPFAAGFGLGVAMDEDTATNLFLGVALVATSVGITSAVMLEFGAIRSPAGRTILGAAVLDDILALILLAVATGVAAEGGVDATALVLVIALSVAFVAFFALGGTALMRARPQILGAPRFSESPLLPAVLICLGLAALAAEIGLATIIGAFLAGMIIAETKEQHPVEEEIAPLYAFLPPFFFAFIGLSVDLGTLVDPSNILLLLGVTAIAIVTKFSGAWIGARARGPRRRLRRRGHGSPRRGGDHRRGDRADGRGDRRAPVRGHRRHVDPDHGVRPHGAAPAGARGRRGGASRRRGVRRPGGAGGARRRSRTAAGAVTNSAVTNS